MSDDSARTSRRGFLASAGATGTLLGVGGLADLGSALGTDRQQEQVATHYRLGGRTAAWQGLEPQSIAGTSNPTLNLEAGQDYAITWRNVDGAPHNVAILAENGDVLEATEIISEQGATQTLRFTASEEMATYICQVHPNSMVGAIAFGAQAPTGNQTAGNQTTAAPTTVPNPTEAPVTETTHPLADEYGENPLKFQAELQPPEGVQTQATGTTWFTLHPPNGVRAKMMYSLYVEDLNEVTGVAIHLDSSGENDPVVAQLFQPGHPVDATRGQTLVDSLIDARDLQGPFEGEPLLRLTEAIRNGNVYAQVQARTGTAAQAGTTTQAGNATATQTATTTQGGSSAVLRGPIRVVKGETEDPTATGTTAQPGNATETGNAAETTAGNETTQSE